MSMYSAMTKGEVDVISVKFLESWKRTKLRNVSLDFDTHKALFPFLEPIKVIKDAKSSKPLFVIVDREKSIELIKEYRNLQDGNCGSGLRQQIDQC